MADKIGRRSVSYSTYRFWMDRYDMYVFGVVPMSINPVGTSSLAIPILDGSV
jgi:hypothetical protein